MKKYNENYHLYCDEYGVIYSVNGHVIPTRMREGRRVFVYWDNEIGKNRYVIAARVICDTFHQKQSDADVVLHINGNITDDVPENLKWVSRSEMKKMMYELKGSEYKLKTSTEIFGVVSLAHYRDGEYVYHFATPTDATKAGFNYGRIYSAYKFDRKYKGVYWVLKSVERF